QYYIFRMRQGGKRELIQVVPGSDTSYEDTDVENGVVYFYYLRSYNSKYNIHSSWSAPTAMKAVCKSEA
ncbi:MAG: hypothetical protein IKK28_08815, partial [Mogibacterium sp.]|nr:hypothetical protein [Mogibacterium sp.]